MNKVTAHSILAVFDIAALAACYYVFTEWRSIDELISIGSNSVSMQSHLGFYLLSIMVPVVHILTLFKWPESAKKLGNLFLVALFVLLMVGAFTLDSSLEDKLLSAGYHYCTEQSEAMTFSEFKTYVKDTSQCIE